MRELNVSEVECVDGAGWIGTAIRWSVMGAADMAGNYFGQDNGGPQTWEVEQNSYVF
jgi:hypothetical protein